MVKYILLILFTYTSLILIDILLRIFYFNSGIVYVFYTYYIHLFYLHAYIIACESFI